MKKGLEDVNELLIFLERVVYFPCINAHKILLGLKLISFQALWAIPPDIYDHTTKVGMNLKGNQSMRLESTSFDLTLIATTISLQ